MNNQVEFPVVSPAGPGPNTFRVEVARHSCADARIEATLECSLIGVDSSLVSKDEKLDSRQRMAMIETAVRQLGKNSGLTLSFLNHVDGVISARQPSLTLGVACASGSLAEARQELSEILPFLESQTGYRFEAESCPAIEAGRYATFPELTGVMVSTRCPKGLSVGSQSMMPVLFHRPGNYQPMRSAWSVFSHSRLSASLELALHMVELQDESLANMEKALNLLLRGEAVLVEYPSKRLLVPGEADAHYEHVKLLLDKWLRYPRGVRLTARLSSDTRLPAGLSYAVAGALYPGRHFRLVDHCPLLPQALDLRTCFNESFHLPDLMPSLMDVAEMEIPAYPMPRISLPSKGTLLGEGSGQPACLDSQARLRHVFVLGQTGSGKSTLLLNMIRQDMLAGEGVCLVDPNGDLYEDVMRHVPPERADEVVLLDAGNFDRSFGLNFLELSGPHPEVMASQNANALLHILGHLYDLRQAGGPMFEMYMRAALLLVMLNRLPGLTLIEAARVFSDKAYRRYLVRHCTDPETVHFWRHVAEPVDGENRLSNMAPYVVSKLNQMTHNALVKPIIGQSRSSVVFRDLMDKGQIVLINLSKGRVGEMDARFLGMMLLSKLSSAALGRADAMRETRKPFHVYVDEYHNYADEECLSLLLAEGRKYGVGLTLATQHMKQLNAGQGAGEALSAVMGNAATHVYFRTGPIDADTLAPFLGSGIPYQQIPYLPDFTAVVRIMAEGRPLPPFVINAAPTQEPEWSEEESRMAANRMRVMYGQYTRSAAEVEAEIGRRGELPAFDSTGELPAASPVGLGPDSSF